jgi:hypothetical protein
MPNPAMVVRDVVDSDEKPLGRWCWTWCPACDEAHVFKVVGKDGTVPTPCWGWDGNVDEPTFEGSLLHTHLVTCHSFLRVGAWQFLGDCTHAMAGQTAPMVPLPDWLCDEDG